MELHIQDRIKKVDAILNPEPACKTAGRSDCILEVQHPACFVQLLTGSATRHA